MFSALSHHLECGWVKTSFRWKKSGNWSGNYSRKRKINDGIQYPMNLWGSFYINNLSLFLLPAHMAWEWSYEQSILWCLCTFFHSAFHCTFHVFFSAESPKITCQPVSQNDVVPGNTVVFTIQATGSQPLNYHWEWKPAVEGGRGEEWQPCPAGWCDGGTLTIPRAHKSIEGSYRCSVSNNNGSHTSEPAELSVGKNDSCISQLLCNEKRKSWQCKYVV